MVECGLGIRAWSMVTARAFGCVVVLSVVCEEKF